VIFFAALYTNLPYLLVVAPRIGLKRFLHNNEQHSKVNTD